MICLFHLQPAMLACLALAVVHSASGHEPPASSAAAPVTVWDQDYALGGWGGRRARLADQGMVFNFTYSADAIGIVSGGIKRGLLYNGLLDLETDVDLEKLAGWRGGHLHVNGFHPHGRAGSAVNVGDIGTFSGIDAYDAYRLYELWLEQDLFDDRLSLRIGQITLDSEFALLDSYGGLFVHSGFGTPLTISANLPLPAYPNSTLGARVRFEPAQGLYFQAAVFDGNTAPGLFTDSTAGAAASTEFNRHGTHWALRADEGALWIGEIGLRHNQARTLEASATRTTLDSALHPAGTVEPQRGLAGSCKAGFVFHTDTFADVSDTTLAGIGSSLAPGSNRNRRANYALYASLEQELWREPGSEAEGLGVFAQASWMPGDRNTVDFSFEGGVHYQGLFSARDDDALGLGIVFLRISDSVRRAVSEANQADGTSFVRPDFEAAFELVYRCQAAPWLSIQPHVQYILQPGGSSARDPALIVGIRANITF